MVGYASIVCHGASDQFIVRSTAVGEGRGEGRCALLITIERFQERAGRDGVCCIQQHRVCSGVPAGVVGQRIFEEFWWMACLSCLGFWQGMRRHVVLRHSPAHIADIVHRLAVGRLCQQCLSGCIWSPRHASLCASSCTTTLPWDRHTVSRACTRVAHRIPMPDVCRFWCCSGDMTVGSTEPADTRYWHLYMSFE